MDCLVFCGRYERMVEICSNFPRTIGLITILVILLKLSSDQFNPAISGSPYAQPMPLVSL